MFSQNVTQKNVHKFWTTLFHGLGWFKMVFLSYFDPLLEFWSVWPQQWLVLSGFLANYECSHKMWPKKNVHKLFFGSHFVRTSIISKKNTLNQPSWESKWSKLQNGSKLLKNAILNHPKPMEEVGSNFTNIFCWSHFVRTSIISKKLLWTNLLGGQNDQNSKNGSK